MTAAQIHGLIVCLTLAGILGGLLATASLCVAAARPRPTRGDDT